MADDLPPTLRGVPSTTAEIGPGETADFTFVPTRPGSVALEVRMRPVGSRVAMVRRAMEV